MPDRRMFWRVLHRLIGAHRARLLVVLLGLGAGATLTAALLNLQVDAKARLTREFRSFGANVLIAPHENNTSSSTLDEAVIQRVRQFPVPPHSSAVAYLYVIADVVASGRPATKVVVSGTRIEIEDGRPMAPGSENNVVQCSVGSIAAVRLRVAVGDELRLRNDGTEFVCRSSFVPARGDQTDSQIAVPLGAAQRLATTPGKVSLVQLSIAGTPDDVSDYVSALGQRIPEADVQGLRQFTGAEAKIYNRICALLAATVAVVLILTSLCVMAAMTNVAMERRNDVGLMKAIGGATRRIMRFFLAEAAIFGLVAGLAGSAVGIFLSMWLGKAVFGVAARPRLIVYPFSVLLTMIVATISAYPVRRLGNISPASVFRGEA